ncbi:MAG: phosphoribosyltransferase family protein [Chitinophagales bacterium]
MSKQQSLIIDKKNVQQKITRIAYQILEDNYKENEIVLIGIRNKGYLVAEKLKKTLEKIRTTKVQLFEIKLDKKQPNKNEIEFDFDPTEIKNKSIVLVDDVANTGKTIFYALSTLMDHNFKKIQIAVLIDREHKSFPIRADYVGMSLSTTLKEHVEVMIDKDETAVYLS